MTGEPSLGGMATVDDERNRVLLGEFMTHSFRKAGWWFALVLPLSSTGCLSPELVNQTIGGLYPTAPGAQPYVAIRVINDTTATLDIPVVYDDGTVPTYSYLIQGLTPEGRDTGIVLQWPIIRVAVGDLNNPLSPLILAYFPDGSTSAVIFGQPALQAGVDYDRGDTIVFHFIQDSRSSAYIRVQPGRILGADQQGPFTRDNPFERLQVFQTVTGF